MTADTDFAGAANRALRFSDKKRKPKKAQEAEPEQATDVNGNPVDHETRFGVLPPWGGAWGNGGASTPIEHEPQVINDDD